MSTVAESSIFASPESSPESGYWPTREDVFAEISESADETGWQNEDSATTQADSEYLGEVAEAYLGENYTDSAEYGYQSLDAEDADQEADLEDADPETFGYEDADYEDVDPESSEYGYAGEDAGYEEADEETAPYGEEVDGEEIDYEEVENEDLEEESGEVEEYEFDETFGEDEAFIEGETFPSGLVLTARPGPEAPGQEHWDPNKTGLPLYDTGPEVRRQQISPHFTVGELVTSGGRAADRARISPALIQCLEAIRVRAGRPVRISSGYRSWARNAAVYKQRNKKPTLSRHCSGQAADITIAGLTGLQIAEIAIEAYGNNIGLGIGKTFAHVDVRGRPDTWAYFGGAAKTAALGAVERYRSRGARQPRPRAVPGPAPAPQPAPTPTPSGTGDRARGIVRRGTFKACSKQEQPGARAMADQWKRLTGRSAGTHSCRKTTWGTPSLHGEGRSIDLNALVSDPRQRAQADAYVAWMQANAVELQVAYIIWNRRQWSWQSRAKGWRPYGGTNPHTDHVHVDLSWEGALTPSRLFAGPVPGLGSGTAPTPPGPRPTPKPAGNVPAHVVEFVRKYRPHAQANEARSRIPWLVTLGQAALESGWGKRSCGNNYFGIKARTTLPAAQRKLCQTKEVHKTSTVQYPEVVSVTQRPDGRFDYVVKDWFRLYSSPAGSFDDHARVLLNRRYAKAFAHTRDPYAFAREIAAAGYATAPDYARVLTGVMKLIDKVPQ
ncbi:glucosaminidase domain-containing protein [Nocardia sp. NPDC058518]|uniref:glucosaminidase domain-containing protein n=1 Tax=Nocardia sp. NPDC058518 TaxID=3346534 RepID=UPI003661F758